MEPLGYYPIASYFLELLCTLRASTSTVMLSAGPTFFEGIFPKLPPSGLFRFTILRKSFLRFRWTNRSWDIGSDLSKNTGETAIWP